MSLRKLGLLGALSLATLPAPTHAAPPGFGGLTPSSCVKWVSSGASCDDRPGAPGLDRPEDAVISPDGRHVYVASMDTDSVAMLARDGPSGALSALGCVQAATVASTECESTAPGLVDPRAIAIAADGLRVYVGTDAAQITTLSRDPATGVLDPVGCVKGGAAADGCDAAGGYLAAVADLAIAGDHLYAGIDAAGGGVTVLTRTPGAGELTYAGCVRNPGGDGCEEVKSLTGAPALAATPGAEQLLAATPAGGGALTVLGRDATSGALSQSACLNAAGSDGCTQAASVAAPAAVVAAADGADVYVANAEGWNVLRLSRDAAGGALAAQECVGDPDAGAPCPLTLDGLANTTALAASADARTLYAAGLDDQALVALDRGPGGALTPVNCVRQTGATTAGCTDAGLPLTGVTRVFASPDGRHVYALNGGANDAVSWFARELPPACEGGRAAVASGGSVTVALSCSDPNGDPTQLEVFRAPYNGRVDAIDQAARTLTYTARAGFGGSDSLTFRATDGTLGSAPSTLRLDVARPAATVPAPTPRPPAAAIATQLAPPLRIIGGTLRADRRGRVAIRLSCLRAPCGARLTVRSARRLRQGGRRRTVVFGRARYSLRQGRRGTVRIRMSSDVHRLLRRLRRVTVTVAAYTPTGDFLASTRALLVRRK